MIAKQLNFTVGKSSFLILEAILRPAARGGKRVMCVARPPPPEPEQDRTLQSALLRLSAEDGHLATAIDAHRRLQIVLSYQMKISQLAAEIALGIHAPGVTNVGDEASACAGERRLCD